MAANGGRTACTGTLVADTADLVTLTAGGAKTAEVINHGDGLIYYRADGVVAVGEADDCGVILAGERLTIGLSAEGTVSLISAGTPGYTVQIP